MASPSPRVPRVPNPWASFAEQIGKQIASGRPQPTARMTEMITNALKSDSPTHAGVNDQLAALHAHAKMAHGGDGPYPIKGWKDEGEPVVDATIAQSSPDKFFEQEVYGQDYPQVREAWTSAEQLPEGHVLSLDPEYSDLDRALARRTFEVTIDPTDEQYYSSSSERPGFMTISPGRSASYGSSPDRARNHEYRHMAFVTHPHSQQRVNPAVDMTGHVRQAAAAGGGGIPRGLLHLFADHADYTNSGVELAANLGHMMGLEYGLTGRPIITPEDRIRAVRKWTEGRGGVIKTPAGYQGIFGPDPVMQYGPKAGQPAEGYENMRQILRQLLPTMTPQMKKDVIKAMGHLGSTEPSREVQHA